MEQTLRMVNKKVQSMSEHKRVGNKKRGRWDLIQRQKKFLAR